MADRVTIQDIADALGVSRNTVSKAINNTGILAEATRNRVLQKAVEMGYKQFSYVNISGAGQTGSTLSHGTDKSEIALFTSNFIGNSHFASTMLDKFQRELSMLGYSFTMHRLQPHESESLAMPASYNKERTAGIICIEMFNRAYCSMLCTLDTPLLFVDAPVSGLEPPLKADLLIMDNQSNIHCFVKEMVRRGKKKIGFIGKSTHCQSFFERFLGYRNAMYLSGLTCPEEYCIIDDKSQDNDSGFSTYQEYLADRIQNLKTMPDVFICANDFIAIDTLQSFKKLGISVPQDIYLCGFDDSPESRILSPTLTTIHIHSQIMGFSAVNLLMSRIKEPSLNFRTIHTETSLIYRESTED
ncbi:MAG: LacI family DNA-binding transcriptional regulator [Blautia sp.]|nr:LacI family DNA-binding transcriptional regulator [Blautia sp.]MCM1202254.1 LacI family DNA-binding transcriptional regulator [Bacteroides fragilis]